MGLVLGAIVVLGLVVAAVAAIARSASSGLQPNQETEADLDTVRTLYEKDGALQIHTDTRSSVILRQSEVALFFAVPAAFSEEKSHTRHGGAGIRMAKGVRILGGESHSIPRIRRIDQGDVLLTNRRVIFTGTLRTVEVRHSQLDALEFNATTLLLRKSGRVKAMYFNLAAGYAMVIGQLIQYLLAHDDWQRMDEGEYPVLLHGGSPHTLENITAEVLARPVAMPAVYAPFLMLVMNADGVVTDEEIDAVREMEPDLPRIFEEVGNCLDGFGLDLADALDAALRWEPEVRQELLESCERLARADGRSDEEQETLENIRAVLRLTE